MPALWQIFKISGAPRSTQNPFRSPRNTSLPRAFAHRYIIATPGSIALDPLVPNADSRNMLTRLLDKRGRRAFRFEELLMPT